MATGIQRIISVCVIATAITSPLSAQQLHAIIVGETSSDEIGMPIGLSVDALVTTVLENVPQDALSLKVLTGKEYNRAKILATIQDLQVESEDAILYFFCGHGYYDQSRGSFFKPPADDGALYLSEICKPLRDKQPRLLVTIVDIVDCCTGMRTHPHAATAQAATVPPQSVSPLFARLFWETSGNLVVNSSAPGQYAVVRSIKGEAGEPGIGALFTNIFTGSLQRHRDERLSWDEIVGECRKSVDEAFRKLHPDGTIRLGQDRSIPQETQTVWGSKNEQIWFPPEYPPKITLEGKGTNRNFEISAQDKELYAHLDGWGGAERTDGYVIAVLCSVCAMVVLAATLMLLKRRRTRCGQRQERPLSRKDGCALGGFDIFLSHSSKDKPAVRQLGEELRRRGMTVWLDEWELVPGRPWQESLEEIIKTAESAAVLVGKDGLGPWENPEMRALLNQFVTRKLVVIPVLLPGAPEQPELPLFLQAFTWVDLRDGLTRDGLDRLQWGVTGTKPHADQSSTPQNDKRAVDATRDPDGFTGKTPSPRISVHLHGGVFAEGLEIVGLLFTVTNTDTRPIPPYQLAVFHSNPRRTWAIFPSNVNGELLPDQRREHRCYVVQQLGAPPPVNYFADEQCGEDQFSMRLMLEHSDKVLYENKRLGRDFVRIYRKVWKAGTFAAMTGEDAGDLISSGDDT
ncbi:MAG: toll/interleukin-1 receptor domain-containing protein [Planctomycetota bacterium]|nr:toll/interleukin-1 receptor domain-containing protein [Planctomycetota bacterium]